MNGGQTLHIEAPGCIVNIMADLKDDEGRAVTTVEILANGERFPSDPWWIVGVGKERGDTKRRGHQLSSPGGGIHASATIRVRHDK